MHRLFLCACVVFLSAGTVSYGSVTSCQTPGNVHVGDLGTIHCSFPESIGDKKFIVVRQGPNSTEDEERIVNCYHINGARRCAVSRGYDFTYTNEPLQTVVIPNVTKQHEGTYICQLIPSDTNDYKPCYLNVTDPDAKILDSSQKQEGKARHNDDNDVNETPNQTSTLPAGAIAGIVVGALGFAVAVAVAVVVFKKSKQTRCKKRGRAANLTVIIGGALTWSEKGDRAPCKLTTIEGGFATSEKGGLTPCNGSPTTEGDDTSSDSSQGSTTPLVKDSMLTVYNFTHEKT